MQAPDDLTALLHGWRSGDGDAREAFVAGLYRRLRTMADQRIRAATGPVTLDPTALVHEAMIRLLEGAPTWRDRAHFLAIASLQMRNVLVDRARARRAQRRGGDAVHATLPDGVADPRGGGIEIDLLALDQALSRLDQRDPRVARVIEMTYFGGMRREEIAHVLSISVPTVDRDLRFGRAWLNRTLGDPA